MSYSSSSSSSKEQQEQQEQQQEQIIDTEAEKLYLKEVNQEYPISNKINFSCNIM